MNKTVRIIFYLLTAVLIGVVGAGGGFWYARRAVLLDGIPRITPTNKVAKGLALSVAGKVAKVEGQQMTLEQEGDTLAFKVDVEAFITQVTLQGEATAPKTEQKELSLEEIEIGSEATALLEIQSDGTWLARAVTVFVEQGE